MFISRLCPAVTFIIFLNVQSFQCSPTISGGDDLRKIVLSLPFSRLSLFLPTQVGSLWPRVKYQALSCTFPNALAWKNTIVCRFSKHFTEDLSLYTHVFEYHETLQTDDLFYFLGRTWIFVCLFVFFNQTVQKTGGDELILRTFQERRNRPAL